MACRGSSEVRQARTGARTGGVLFQGGGDLTAKAQSPLDLQRVWGINKRPWSDYLSDLAVHV